MPTFSVRRCEFILSFVLRSDSPDGLGSTADGLLVQRGGELVTDELTPCGRHLAPGPSRSRRLRRARRDERVAIRFVGDQSTMIARGCSEDVIGSAISGHRPPRAAAPRRSRRRPPWAAGPVCRRPRADVRARRRRIVNFRRRKTRRGQRRLQGRRICARRQAVHASARRRRGAARTDAAEKLKPTPLAAVLANRCVARTARAAPDRSDADKKASEAAALADAHAAVAAAPNWPKAHYRLGQRHMHRKDFTKAHAAFKQGWHLDTKNEELTEACREALEAMAQVDREGSMRRAAAAGYHRGGGGAGGARGGARIRRAWRCPCRTTSWRTSCWRTRSSSASRCPASPRRADRAQRELDLRRGGGGGLQRPLHRAAGARRRDAQQGEVCQEDGGAGDPVASGEPVDRDST